MGVLLLWGLVFVLVRGVGFLAVVRARWVCAMEEAGEGELGGVMPSGGDDFGPRAMLKDDVVGEFEHATDLDINSAQLYMNRSKLVKMSPDGGRRSQGSPVSRYSSRWSVVSHFSGKKALYDHTGAALYDPWYYCHARLNGIDAGAGGAVLHRPCARTTLAELFRTVLFRRTAPSLSLFVFATLLSSALRLTVSLFASALALFLALLWHQNFGNFVGAVALFVSLLFRALWFDLNFSCASMIFSCAPVPTYQTQMELFRSQTAKEISTSTSPVLFHPTPNVLQTLLAFSHPSTPNGSCPDFVEYGYDITEKIGSSDGDWDWSFDQNLVCVKVAFLAFFLVWELSRVFEYAADARLLLWAEGKMREEARMKGEARAARVHMEGWRGGPGFVDGDEHDLTGLGSGGLDGGGSPAGEELDVAGLLDDGALGSERSSGIGGAGGKEMDQDFVDLSIQSE